MLFLILSFVLPFINSDGTGDARGGSEVNSFEQAHFILSCPLQYTEILLRFLRRYLSPDLIAMNLTSFAYLEAAPEYWIYLILLGILAFTDKNGRDYAISGGWKCKWLMLGILFGTVCLFATALYVAFTPVGMNTINGCQPRYLFPLLFPAMMLIGSQRIENRMNKTIYHGLAFTTMGYVGFSSILLLIVNLYS